MKDSQLKHDQKHWVKQMEKDGQFNVADLLGGGEMIE